MKVEISDVKLPTESLKPNMPILGVVIVQNDGKKEQKIEQVTVNIREGWNVPVPRMTYNEAVAQTMRVPYDTAESFRSRVQLTLDSQPTEEDKYGEGSEVICFEASSKKDIINLTPGSVLKYNFNVKMPSTWNPRSDPASRWNIHLQGYAGDKKNHFYSDLIVLPVAGSILVPSIGEAPPALIQVSSGASTPQGKLFCRNCGKEMRLDSKFCDGCGQKV